MYESTCNFSVLRTVQSRDDIRKRVTLHRLDVMLWYNTIVQGEVRMERDTQFILQETSTHYNAACYNKCQQLHVLHGYANTVVRTTCFSNAKG